MISVRVQLDGLKNTEQKLKNLERVMQKIAVYLQSETQKTFERNTGRVTKWPDLSEKTKKYKIKKKGTPYPMLVFTGRLRQSIFSEYSSTFARIFAGVKYAVYHQLGTRKMPARPILEIDERKDIDFITSEISKWLKD